MVRKPDIQYVQEFYVHGSEARVIELKPRRRVIRTILPKVAPDKSIRIGVDPVALCGIVVAAVMLILMLVGTVQYVNARNEYQAMSNQVIELQNENVMLRQQYRSSYDLDQVAHMANSLGMIPVEEAQVMYINPVVPVREPEPTVWENIRWFMDGLFA
jgi:cell division protein FtsL